MAWTKTQTVVACAAGLLLLGGASAITWNSLHNSTREVVLDAAPTTTQSPLPAGHPPVFQTEEQPTTFPVDWQSQFKEAYGLPDGQVIRHVSAPFITARQAFWDQQQREQGMKSVPPLWKGESLVIVWDGATPHWYSASLDGGTLDDALWFCANLRPWDLDKSVPRQLKLPGDFSVRKGATAEQVMEGLAPIVSLSLGRPIRFEKRYVATPALVVSGTYRYVPMAGARKDGVIDFAPNYAADLPIREGSQAQMLSAIKNELNIRVIDESDSSKLPVRWRYDDRWINSDQLVANVARQTSLHIAREPREANIWFMVNGRPSH